MVDAKVDSWDTQKAAQLAVELDNKKADWMGCLTAGSLDVQMVESTVELWV